MRVTNKVLLQVLATIGDPDAFAAVMDGTRCYGDESKLPVLGPDSSYRVDQLREADTKAIKYHCTRLVIEQAAEKLALTPKEVEFVQGLFEFVFDGENMPAEFGHEHEAGIAACVWFSIYKDKTSKEGRRSLKEEQVRTLFCAQLDDHYGWALGKVDDSFTKFKNRFSRRQLYARARARGKMVDKEIGDRATKEVCGRDITGELKTEVYLLGTE